MVKCHPTRKMEPLVVEFEPTTVFFDTTTLSGSAMKFLIFCGFIENKIEISIIMLIILIKTKI